MRPRVSDPQASILVWTGQNCLGQFAHVASVYCYGGLDEKMDAGTEFTPQGSIEGISARALAHVSRLLNRPIETALDLAEVTRKGVVARTDDGAR